MSEWDVPGYDVLELLGFGTGGEVWRARERSSRTLVALRRLAGGDRAAVTAVRTQATTVRSLPTAHVVRLRTTTRAGRDDVLVMDHAGGGSLRSLLLRRGRLEPGEVVTAVAPLAEALGQAHAHGLVHGRVGASEVLLTAGGMPLLDGLGLGSLHSAEDSLDPTGALGASADVWALGALAHLLLAGEEPGTTILASLAPRAPLPLVRAIEAALGFDPTTRPSAADLAASLLAACPAAPLEGVRAAAERPTAPRRLPTPRRVLTAAAMGVGVLGVVGAGVAWGQRTTEHPTRIATASTAPVAQTVAAPTVAQTVPVKDWGAVLRTLDAARCDAFAQAEPALLVGVYAAGSPLLAADRAVLQGLAAQRRTAVGVAHEVRAVTPVRIGPDRAELRVAEVLGAYDVLDGAGRVVSAHPAGREVTHTVLLVSIAGGWRVSQVSLRA
jgi:hypothetical protein